MNWIKKITVNSIIVLTSLIIGLMIVELFLYLENKHKPIDYAIIEINDYKYPFIKGNSTRDPLALNEVEHELLVVGDSFVAGTACARDNANFPSHLQMMLEGKTNVVNLGVEGANPADYIDFLDGLNISKGDVSLITLYDNDIHVAPKTCLQSIRQAEKHKIHVPEFCKNTVTTLDKANENIAQKINNRIKKFKTVVLIKESLVQIPFLRKYFFRTAFRNLWIDFDSDENKWMRSTLKAMAEQMKQNGGEALFIYYPNTNRISVDDERHEAWLKFINYVSKNDNIKIADPYPFFIANATSQSMVWSLTDKHPNCEAHSLMADFTFKKFKGFKFLNE
tara:strand:- start:369 stop:1376 length:1008 start_codon:yes stop_codon:yes gene_type:complete